MEKPAEQEEAVVEVVGDGDLQTPERRSVRRRLIQSTLFPHRSQDKDKEVEEKLNDDDCNEGDDEDEEYCGTQSKRKKKPKRKATPPSSKKKSVDKQVTENGKEGPSGRVNKKDSPASVKSNFFTRVSDRRLQKKQEKEQQCDDSPEGNSKMSSPLDSVAKDMRSPQKLKEKRKKNSTPTKSAMTNGLKVPCSTQLSTSPIPSEQVSQPIPDLRLEAKLTAEENSRLFAGRQIHPFFSSKKSSKKYQEIIEVDDYNCAVERKNKSVTLGPIHVFETLQDEVMPFDWKNWIFFDKTFPTSSCAPKSAFSSIFEGSVESLNIDKFLEVPHLSTASILEKRELLDQCPIEAQRSRAHACSATLTDEQVACYQLLKDMKMNHEVEKVGIFPGHAGNVENLEDDPENRFSEERLTSYYLGSSNLPQDILWTEKYQPEKSMEVCGNSESVKLLNEWLHLWHERDFRTSKDFSNDDKCITQNSDDDYYDSDCDSENSEKGANLKNVLLVTGPVGSGKSAAIYACAKEQGFKVIEVNTSDWRNGALVKQNFREAVESHRLKWSLTNHVGSRSKCIIGSSPAQPNSDTALDFDSEVIELIPLSDEEECPDAIRTNGKENRAACGRDGIKSLVLFEDVDITFIEDRGFIGAIQQLAETAKLPMILTTNSNGPVLPENLDRLELCFTIPSPMELLSHVDMVCAAENASINSHLRERFVEYFHGDIRKTIMHLQFWCQGKRDTTDWKGQRTYGPLLFNILAGHHILPKIIPWDFPSQLSEVVESEISKSLSNIEENYISMKVVGEEKIVNEEMQNGLQMDKNGRDSIEAKKEAILSSCSFYDYNEFQAPTENCPDSSDSSGSPVAFTRRNVRKKLDRLLSFNSEDESCGGRFHEVAVKETNNEVNLNYDYSIPSPPATENCLNQIMDQLLHCDIPHISPETQNCLNLLTDQLFHSEDEKMQEIHYEGSYKAVDLYVNDICRSVDISCVPESSFVPETEMNDGTELVSGNVSCFHAPGIEEAISMSTELIQNFSPVRPENSDKPLSRLRKRSETMRNIFDANVESTRGEEVGDSQNEHLESVTRGYQVMDECSRMDFNKKIVSFEIPGSCVVTDSVQETWSKLRECHTDLKQYATLEQKHASQIVQLAFEISSLISDADLLLSNNNFLTSDSLEPSMVHSEESDASGWYNEQLQMTSTLAEHGFCLYTKDIAATGSTISSNSRVDLVSEMLASTDDTMALGKLVRQGMEVRTLHTIGTPETRPSQPGVSLKRKTESCHHDIIQSLVPSRSHLALKGDAFCEYLSSLGQISRSEATRLSSGIAYTKRRRGRAARHYLSTGALGLSPEDISLLNQYSGYGKSSVEQVNTSLR